MGKTAFDGAVKAAPEPTAKQAVAQESAFSKANTAGMGPHFGSDSPKVRGKALSISMSIVPPM